MKFDSLKGFCAVGALIVAGHGVAWADRIDFTGSQKEGIVSGEYWSDKNPPSPGNDYYVATTRFLYTPEGGTYEFAGDSLTIGTAGTSDNGYAIMMLLSGVDLTVNDLRLAYGRVGSWSSAESTLRGSISVLASNPDRPFEFYGQGNSDVLDLYAKVTGSSEAQLRTWCDRANNTFNLHAHGDCFAEYEGTLTLAAHSKFSGETPRAGALTKMTVESGAFGGTLVLEDNAVLEATSSTVAYEVENLTLGANGDFRIRLPYDKASGRSALLKVTGAFVNGANSVTLEFPVADMIDAENPFGPIALMKFAGGTEPDVGNFIVNDDVYAYRATVDLVVETDPADNLPTLYIRQHGKVLTRTTEWESVTNGGWSDGNPPSPANDYKCGSNKNVYTPSGDSWSFPGRSLMLGGTIFYIKSSYSEMADLRVLTSARMSYLFGSKDGKKNATKFYEPAAGNQKITGRIRFENGDGATLIFQSAGDCSVEVEAPISGGKPDYTLKSDNTKGGTIKAQAYSVGGGAYRGYLGLFGVNDKYYGKVTFSYDGTPSDWENSRSVIFIRDGRSLGGPVQKQMIDALSFSVRNSVLCPLESCTLDTENRCLWINADGATLDIPENVVLTLRQLVWFEKHTLHKTGAGTLAFGSDLNFSGSTTPAQGMNKIDIDEGTIRPIRATAFNGLELTFAEGAKLELDIPESNTDGDVGQYGMLNTKWDKPLVVPEGGLRPIIRNPNGLTRLRGVKVPICTVNATAAEAIRTNRMLLNPVSPVDGYTAVVKETANADSSVTFAAEFQKGLVITVR